MGQRKVLITGGCGYIGSHTIVCLLNKDYDVVVVDNLINSTVTSLDRVANICQLSDEQRANRLVFHQVDICDEFAFRQVFEHHSETGFVACIHFAGLKVLFPPPLIVCFIIQQE
jgi:UDP-glucose 4-epimerase